VANETKNLISASLKRLRERYEKDFPNSEGGHKAGIRSAIASVNATRVPDDVDVTAAIAAAVSAERVSITEALKARLDKPYKSGTYSLYDAEAEDNRHLGHEDGIEEAIYLIRERQELTQST
jgi:hypothetical protein